MRTALVVSIIVASLAAQSAWAQNEPSQIAASLAALMTRVLNLEYWRGNDSQRVYFIAGNSCTSMTGGQTPGYSQYGIYAKGSAPVDVTCPITVRGNADSPPTQASLAVSGHSRSASDRVACGIRTSDARGQHNGLARYKRVEVPYTGGPAESGAGTVAYGLYEPLWLHCRLPAATASGFSYLTSIEVWVF